MKGIFVTGNGTGIGKTVVSAILVKALNADYWKPLQAGSLDCTDRATVANLTSPTNSVIHQETYVLGTFASPHEGSQKEQVEIDFSRLTLLPKANRPLIVEGVGGIMSPISAEHLNLDFIKKISFPTLIVSRTYLGSINHTLMTIEILKQNQIPILGLIFNGDRNSYSEDFITKYSTVANLGFIPTRRSIDASWIQEQAFSVQEAVDRAFTQFWSSCA
ncbi:dethiobiotin synthase [bacterium]|nr:dethiobiotin synthase [bacterium]